MKKYCWESVLMSLCVCVCMRVGMEWRVLMCIPYMSVFWKLIKLYCIRHKTIHSYATQRCTHATTHAFHFIWNSNTLPVDFFPTHKHFFPCLSDCYGFPVRFLSVFLLQLLLFLTHMKGTVLNMKEVCLFVCSLLYEHILLFYTIVQRFFDSLSIVFPFYVTQPVSISLCMKCSYDVMAVFVGVCGCKGQWVWVYFLIK